MSMQRPLTRSRSPFAWVAFALRLKDFTAKHPQLRKAKADLEVRLKEQTAELAAANDALQKENLERQKAASTA